MKTATLRARTIAFSSFAVLSEALSPVVAPAVELSPSDVVAMIPEIDRIDFGELLSRTAGDVRPREGSGLH